MLMSATQELTNLDSSMPLTSCFLILALIFDGLITYSIFVLRNTIYKLLGTCHETPHVMISDHSAAGL